MPQFAAAYPLAAGMAAGLALTGVGYGISVLTADPMDDFTPDMDDHRGTTLDNFSSTQAPVPLIYGRCRVGVNRVFAMNRGENNKYLHLLCLLGEGEISGIVRLGGETFTDTGTVFPIGSPPLVYFDDVIWNAWGGDGAGVEIYLFNGSYNQSAAITTALYGEDFPHPMRHSAYLHIVMEYESETHNRIPKITAVVEGLKIYNPITLKTEYSNNPALCIHNFLSRPSTRGGMGFDKATDIESQTLADAIDYCDDKGWTCNLPIDKDVYAADNLKKMLVCMRGKLPPTYSGFHRLLFRDLNYESVVMAVTEDDVLSNTLTLQQPDNLSVRPNAIRVKFLNSRKNYILDDWVYTDQVALAEDGDYREMEIKLLGLDGTAMQEMAYYRLERARNNRTVSFTSGRRTLALEPEDLITLTHSALGWTAQMLRVVRISPDLSRFTNKITCLMESTEFYDKDYDYFHEELYDTNLFDISAAVPSVINISEEEEVYHYRGQSYTRWRIDFDRPDDTVYPWWDYAEVWLKIGDDGNWKCMTRSEQNYVVDPVEEGVRYYLKLVGVNIHGKKESFDSAPSVSRRITGVTSDPDSLLYLTALVDGMTVNLYSDPVVSPDIDGYETRLGSSFVGGIFLSYDKAPSVKLVGVRPGSHTFWMSPVRLSTTGERIYSTAPVSASCTVFIPPGYTSYDDITWDYANIGTYLNTEYTTYSSDSALKCSHTNDVLSGDWTSPIWDMGIIRKAKLWANFETAFVASTMSFNGIFGTDKSASDKDAETKSFADLIGTATAGQISVTMYYSENGATYTPVKFFEIFAAEVQARYVYIKINIADSTLDSRLYVKEITLFAYSGAQ